MEDFNNPNSDFEINEPDDVSQPEGSIEEPEVVTEPSDTIKEPEIVTEPSDTIKEQEAVAEPSDTIKEQEAVAEPSDTIKEQEIVTESEETIKEQGIEIDEKTAILNNKLIDLMAQRKAASECCINATNPEDRERFADEEYRIAQEIDLIRKEIIENNNRRK